MVKNSSFLKSLLSLQNDFKKKEKKKGGRKIREEWKK
jgi:hypothetical protein